MTKEDNKTTIANAGPANPANLGLAGSTQGLIKSQDAFALLTPLPYGTGYQISGLFETIDEAKASDFAAQADVKILHIPGASLINI